MLIGLVWQSKIRSQWGTATIFSLVIWNQFLLVNITFLFTNDDICVQELFLIIINKIECNDKTS